MKSFRYVGEPANIGRWGWCVGGEILEMDEKEAADIAGDKRFEPITQARQSIAHAPAFSPTVEAKEEAPMAASISEHKEQHAPITTKKKK